MPIISPRGKRMPDEEPDRAWLWIIGSGVVIVLVISALMYVWAAECPATSPGAAPPEVSLLVCR